MCRSVNPEVNESPRTCVLRICTTDNFSGGFEQSAHFHTLPVMGLAQFLSTMGGPAHCFTVLLSSLPSFPQTFTPSRPLGGLLSGAQLIRPPQLVCYCNVERKEFCNFHHIHGQVNDHESAPLVTNCQTCMIYAYQRQHY